MSPYRTQVKSGLVQSGLVWSGLVWPGLVCNLRKTWNLVVSGGITVRNEALNNNSCKEMLAVYNDRTYAYP